MATITAGSMSSGSAAAPENMRRHLRLLSASVSGSEARVREVLAEDDWPSQADLETLRQALVKVATKGSLGVLRLLLASGADVHPRGGGGSSSNELSPLFKAAEAGHLPVVAELLVRGADPDWQGKMGQTALFRAAEGGHLPVVATLLARGADPNLRAKNGQTALFLACLRRHNRVVEALLDGGADADGARGQDGRPGDKDGRTPLLLLASEKSTRWNMETVRILLARGADPDARDSTRRTPLHWAATNGHLELARALLSGEPGEEEGGGGKGRRADINAAQNRGKTALHLASEHNRVDFVDLLLAHGAHVDATSDGRWTPLINAAERGHAAVVARLLAAGASVNAELSNHMTALHWASSNGHAEVARLLLARPEANLARKDQFERTPMICAAERYHNDIVQMLSPARHAHRLSASAREACQRFEATVVDFGEFQETRFLKNDVKEKKPQLVFKHTVYDLLYGWDDRTGKPTVPVLTKNIKWEPHFRWIHLPANNIAWIETLLAKSFIEGGHRDVEGFKALGKCFDQEHRGPLAHANFMRTYCHRVPSRRGPDRDDSGALGAVTEQAGERNLQPASQPGSESVVMTNQSENSTGNTKPATGSKKKSKSEQFTERHGQRQKRNKGPPGNPPGTKEARLNSRQSSWAPSLASTEAFKQLVNNGKMVIFMPFLHYETHDRLLNMTNTIKRAHRGARPPLNASKDELLVHAYMENCLHPRRTLDQFFYHGIDTTKRDSDQVVWRYCQKHRKFEEPKLFMVDQLWMWILGGDTVITCFPQRWEQPKQDPLNVVDGIIEETNAKTRPRIQSVYDLAMVITNRCAGMFDRHRLDAQQFQFLDMFEASIGNVTNEESKLFSKFNQASEQSTRWLYHRRRHRRGRRGAGGSRRSRRLSDSAAESEPETEPELEPEGEFSDDLLHIHQETRLLAEIKDIQDELNIIRSVLHSQELVLDEFQHNVEQELFVEGNGGGGGAGGRRAGTDAILKDIRRRCQEQLRLITMHENDIDRMNDQGQGIYLSLTNLLDLKQKHSNALEARFAREQAIIAAKQGQTIMVFTIVTIIFLPMSFIASFFAINFQDWGDRLTMGYASKYMFGIGLAISFLFVASAFLMPDISDAWKDLTGSASRTGTARLLRKLTFNSRRKTTTRQRGGDAHGAGAETRDAGLFPPTWRARGDNDDGTDDHHPHRLEKPPGSKGGASTSAYRSWADDDAGWKQRGLDGPADAHVMRMSRERERDRYEQHARLGMSPIRHGGRQLSLGSGHGSGHGAAWSTRPSLDGQARRERFSGDLERGRARDLSRSRVHWEAAR